MESSSQDKNDQKELVTGLKNVDKLEKFLSEFFYGNEDGSGTPDYIRNKYGALRTYHIDGEITVQKELSGEDETNNEITVQEKNVKITISYRPKTRFRDHGQINDAVDCALRNHLQQAGYEVISFYKNETDGFEPHRRTFTLKINPYILKAKNKRQQNRKLKQELDSANEKNRKLDEEKKTLKQISDQGLTTIEQLTEQNQITKKYLQKSNTDNLELKNKIERKQTQTQELKKQAYDVKSKNTNLQKTIAQKDTQNKKLTEELESVIMKNSALQSKTETISDELNSAKRENTKISDMKRGLQRTLKTKQVQNRKLKETIDISNNFFESKIADLHKRVQEVLSYLDLESNRL